jgi:hypothetical protein
MNYVPPDLAPKIYLALLYPIDGRIEKEPAQHQNTPGENNSRNGTRLIGETERRTLLHWPVA